MKFTEPAQLGVSSQRLICVGFEYVTPHDLWLDLNMQPLAL
ncbi:hypothetical protein [uncultured Campylobacter sp.]|nr:hypothetical protein [uncultured Campylobacter sp.]